MNFLDDMGGKIVFPGPNKFLLDLPIKKMRINIQNIAYAYLSAMI